MSNALQVIAGIAVLFFLPGYTLISLLFPRKGELDPEYDQVYRVTLGVALSIAISIMVGFLLNAVGDEQHAYVAPGPLWTVLLSIRRAVTWSSHIPARPKLLMLQLRIVRSEIDEWE